MADLLEEYRRQRRLKLEGNIYHRLGGIGLQSNHIEGYT